MAEQRCKSYSAPQPASHWLTHMAIEETSPETLAGDITCFILEHYAQLGNACFARETLATFRTKRDASTSGGILAKDTKRQINTQ